MRSPSEAELKPVERIWPQRTEAAPAAHVFEGWKDLRPAGTRVTVFGNGPYMRAEQATGRSFEQGVLSDWMKDSRVRRHISPSLKSILCAAAAGDDLASREALDNGEDEWGAHAELTRGLVAGK